MFMAIILIKVHHYIVIIHSDPFNLGYQIFSGVQVMTQWYAPDKKKSAAVKDRSESLQEAYVFSRFISVIQLYVWNILLMISVMYNIYIYNYIIIYYIYIYYIYYVFSPRSLIISVMSGTYCWWYQLCMGFPHIISCWLYQLYPIKEYRICNIHAFYRVDLMEHVVGLILSYPDSMLERFIFPINIFLNCHYKTIKWLVLSPIVVVQMISNIAS